MEWVVGIISGFITGTITCAIFYWLGGKDLRREAADLRRLNILTIQALVNAGLAEVHFDAQGNPRGLVYRFQGSGGVSVGGSANVSVQHTTPASGGVALGGSAIIEIVRERSTESPPEQ